MRTFDFFGNIAEFKEVVPGIDSSTELKHMQASHERSKQKIAGILTPAIYNLLKGKFTGSPSEIEMAAIELLQGAHGNMIAYYELISKIISKKKEQISYYKYEIHMMQENYLDNFAINMDALLDYLDENEVDFNAWNETPIYLSRQNLILKTASEFNSVFPTGGSAYFFNLIVPLQTQVIESEILPRKKLADLPSDLAKTVQYFVAYRTMAKAARLVDYADLPQSLRQKLYVDDSKKNVTDSETVAERYANQFNAEANKYLQRIDMELSKPADTVSEIETPMEDFNLEDDKTFVIS